MKTYIITEKHIEELRELFCISKLQSEELDEWVGTLNYLDKSKAHTIIAPPISPKKDKTDDNI